MRRLSFCPILCCLSAVLLHVGEAKTTNRQPHIVFVMADDYGYNDIGYHGSEIKTPNLDQISANGTRLENYYVQPICTPSRSQFMSGRYQIHTGLQHFVILPEQPNALPRDSPTLADKMKEAGYATHCVGKWHLGFYKREYLPINRGFDTFYGYYLGKQGYFDHKRGYLDGHTYLDLHDQDQPVYNETCTLTIHTGLQHFVILPEQPNALPRDSPTLADKMKEAGYATHCVGKWHLGYYLGKQGYFDHKRGYLDGHTYLDLHDQDQPVYNETGHYSTHLFTSKAIERIQKHDASKPMFMYLAYQAVHGPLQVPDEYVKPYTYIIEDEHRKTYAGMVAAMDEGVGNVTKALQKAGMWDNTVFVFSTDNGGTIFAGGNNYPLRGWKRSLWEGGLHGVGFVHAPNMPTAGTVNKGLIHISDWYPTFVGLAGGVLNDTEPLDGYDQWKTISEGQPSPRKILLHNIDPVNDKVGQRLYNDTFDNRVRAAIRSGDWKLITGDPSNGSWVPPPKFDTSLYFVPENRDPPEKNLWLFNITADPTERHELSAKYPEVVRELLDLLWFFNGTAVRTRFPSKDTHSDPALHGGVWGPWE